MRLVAKAGLWAGGHGGEYELGDAAGLRDDN